ncbi:MAG: hypothetical protein HY846_09700 [Nitrosomonadales bacterium]|nr:hypothetical protein [Nitrosomonadales bacterium]
MKFRLGNTAAYLPFSYYYLGPAAFMAYLLAGRSLLGRFSYRGIFLGLGLIAYLAMIVVANGAVDGLYILRFFWGFLLFYLAFRSGIRLQTGKLLLFLSALTLAEAALINTVISAELLPNYPSAETASGHFATGESYQRPYSFGGSASVTSVILVALLAISRIGWKGICCAVAAICACMSGSGFLALIIYLLAKARPALLLALVPVVAGVVASGEIQKISLEYIHYLLEFKSNQISAQLPANSLLTGIPLQDSPNGMGGDFASLSFVKLNGLAGLVFFLSIVAINTNRANWLPLFILLAGSVHYGVIFFLPGQLIFGYFLSRKPELAAPGISGKAPEK